VAGTLADTQAIAFMLGVSPSTIRSWAHRGLITREGTGSRGRALYDTAAARAAACLLGHVDNARDVRQHQDDCRSSAP